MGLLKTSLILLLPMLVACSELQTLRERVTDNGGESAPQFVPVVDGRLGVHSWLADINELRTRLPESLPEVLDAREEAFRSRPTLENRMRLVMLLLVDQESVQDEKRARLLLRGLDPLPASPDDREFISLLRQFLDRQREYEQKLSVLWKQVTQQNRRIDELEQQLQALTNIEQNIQQREPLPVKENGE
ncbi:MAG: hypothetical protein OEY45_05960 [Gammaproteobacteria bacterium]|nr:hypothetical protein [Gammaproteobacteria bacterium]MDH5514688.1 hypothetical protein [Gammaproteobacteria bacterium]